MKFKETLNELKNNNDRNILSINELKQKQQEEQKELEKNIKKRCNYC